MWTKLLGWAQNLSPVWKTGVAAGIAWDVARLLGPNPPYFAPLAVVLTMQTTVEDSILWGYQRVLGIILGILLAEWSSHVVGIHGWSIGLLVVAGTLIARLLKLGKQAVTQVSVSALLVWVVGVSHPGYAQDRVRDTIVGVVIAIVCNMLILPPDFTPAARKALRRATLRLADRFEVTGAWIAEGLKSDKGDILQLGNLEFLAFLHEAKRQLDEAVHALKYSPLVRSQRARLREYDGYFSRLQFGYQHLSLISRTAVEWKKSLEFDESASHEWSRRLADMGSILREFGDIHFSPKRAKDCSSSSSRAERRPSLRLPVHSYEAALTNQVQQFLEDFAPRID